MIIHSLLSLAALHKTVPMKTPVRHLPAALLAALLLASCSGDKSAAAPASAPTPEVGVVAVKSQTVTLTRELAGRTSPYVVAEVRPQVTGLVQKRAFTEGGLVKQGQLLYKLEDATLRADV